jgi:hypothetical protein
MNIFYKIRHHVAIVLCIAIVATSFTVYAPKASAIPVVEIGGNLFTDIMTTIEQTVDTVMDVVDDPMSISNYIQLLIDRYGMPTAKSATIALVNYAVQKILGGSNDGGQAHFVTDWEDYLYTSPQNDAKKYMNTFYDQTTSGALSTVSEGVKSNTSSNSGIGSASNYSSSLIKAAQTSIDGQPCKVDIQNYASNTSNLFGDGNMKGFMAYFKQCNNQYTYTMIAQSQYQTELSKLQTLADKKQVNGYLPRMVNGIVTVPATLFENAMSGVDQMGNNMIVNAKTYQELIAGAAITVGARTMQYKFGNTIKKATASASK